MDEDEDRGQVSQGSMEESMDTMKDGAGKAADAASQGAKFVGDKLKSTKMAQRVQKAKEKAAAKAKAVAKETAKGSEKVVRGATTMGAGAALAGTGAATQAAGAAMSAAGQAITAGTLGFGAAVGEAMDAMGKGMQEAGKGMVKGGKKVMKHGSKTMKKGAEQIAKAPMAKPGKSTGGSDGLGGMPKIDIPFIGRKKTKKTKKEKAKKLLGFAKDHPVLAAIILGAIVLFLLIIFVILAVSSSVNRGKFKEGDYSNVPYVVTKLALNNIQIFSDGNGGYTYGFVDSNGNAITLDEALDNILKTLKDNNSSAYEDLGKDDDERKEFLKLLIQAEVSTQYPNLSLKGTGTSSKYTSGTGIVSSSSGKDYVVATNVSGAATVLDEEGLKKAVNNSNLSDQAKQNVLEVIPDLVRLQEQYHVNALFLIAAARTESGCGTNWNYIDSSTHNWLSVKGHDNGGYVDRNGTSWNTYGSYAEASEAWFKLITGSTYYFNAGKYTVKQIAPTYCDSAWGEKVTKYMDEFYGYAGATGTRQIAAVSNTSISASPSQSQSNIAQWGWRIQNENINAYYYEHGYGTMTYDESYVNGYITQDGKQYIVVSDSGVLKVGPDVKLYANGAWDTFNLELLKNHGVDTTSIQVGTKIDASTVDIVSQEIFEYKKNEIQSQASAKGINLSENQIVALADILYLNGNIDVQLNNIEKYGASSEQLANTSGFASCGENDTPTSRAQVVWKLFHYGKYEARSGSPYDPSYFGGVPEVSNENETSHSGTATAGGVDSNGVTITDNGNVDFLNYAIDCHKLLREDGFTYYSGGRSMPVVKGDSQHTIDCVAYISMALDCYEKNDWQAYPHQLTSSSIITYGSSNLETVYSGRASSINEIPDLQSGDIVVMPGHGQIFYGYSSSGEPVWLNCGANSSIKAVEGKDAGWYATPILYVFRVPSGSGNTYTHKASQTLTGNTDSVQGNIKIKRKDQSGNETVLEYVDESTFDSLIAANNPDAMNVYTLKKGVVNNGGISGNVQLSGSESKEQIWNFLIDNGVTEQGAAALMGNLEAESGCKSVRVQGDYSHSNAAEYSQNYTNQVDSGQITREQFIHNGPGGGGYGLAQWTDPGRKTQLYDYAKSKGKSIGDLQTQLEFLLQELKTKYATIWSALTTSTDMNGTSDLILTRFEIPSDIDGNKPVRRNNAASIYATYSGTRSAGSSSSNSSSNTSSNESSSVASFDNFLFIGDSRYVGIKGNLEGLGNNVSVCAVSGSTAAQWDSIIDSGSGLVSDVRITLPESASGVSVMLGANSGASQLNELKEVMNKLHTRYPSAKVYFNSVYHLGSNYSYASAEDMNAGYDRVNEDMKSFCSSNDWAVYVDITEGLHDENGYLKYPDGEGIHLTDEGKPTLVNNIKNNIKSTGSSSSSNDSESSRANDSSSQYVIALASYDQRTVTNVDSYQYAYTKIISTNSGTVGYGSQFSATPAGYSTTNTVTTYQTTYADYQQAVKNHTLYFDFLWALYIETGNKKLIQEIAEEAINSTLEITVYTDTKVTQNVSTSTIQPKISYKLEGTTAYEDHYNGTNTTTTTNTIVTSKGCLTLANVWNMEYQNEANSYGEFKGKSKEQTREKIEDSDNIMVILREKDRAERIKLEYYMLEDMLEDNNKVSHMIDIFKYYVDIACKKSKKKANPTGGNYIDTNLFDLSNSQASSVKVLLYTRLNISDSEKEQMYKAVEQMTSGFPDNDENTKRKKYIASVILNRALSSKFPDTVSDVLNQGGQFPNYDKSTVDSASYSESTKSAVDSVIQGGDCSGYSVYFNTPSGASNLKWDEKYIKTSNDGDGSDSSYSYYTSEEIKKELKTFEVSVSTGSTMPTDTANKIVQWAEAQVGKSTFHNSHSGSDQVSRNYCAAFVQCAYYEAGLGYYGGNAKDLPHPNAIQFNSDGTVNYSDIPVGAIIVSKGVPVDGVDYGHVCLYVGNGYVIEAGGETIQKKPIEDSFGGKGHNCAPFVGWGFAMADQNEAAEKLVVRIGTGASYPEGWTPNDEATRQATGIEGYYVVNGKQYNVYCQGGNDVWAKMSYSMQDYANSACGATSVAIIASATNSSITPIESGQAAYASVGAAFGSRTKAVTGCDALSSALKSFGLRCEWKSPTKDEVIRHLQTGQPVILLVKGGRVGGNTYGGHYVTLLGMNSQGQIFLGDPARKGANTGYFDVSQFDIPQGGVCFVYNN